MIKSLINKFRYPYRFRKNFKKKFSELKDRKNIEDSYIYGRPFPVGEDVEHLHATLRWLASAHDACDRKGISAKFDILESWETAYPETSGYIINTFLTYSKLFNNPEFKNRAIEIGDWEIEIQRNDGAVLSGMKSLDVRVFNTGQVMLGWIELFEESGESKYLVATQKAANYLLSIQSANGSWEKDTHCDARTYDARVAWALMKIGKLINEPKYIEAAEKNIIWVLGQFTENGWIKNCGFYDHNPITHVLEYTLRGLLEVYAYTKNQKILDQVTQSLDSLVGVSENNFIKNIDGMLPASYGPNWEPDGQTSCLTGTAQFGYLMHRYYQITNNDKFLRFGDRLIEAVKSTQLLNTGFKEIDGAVPGCFPLIKGYCQSSYPNWAAKFFADALIIKIFKDQRIAVKS